VLVSTTKISNVDGGMDAKMGVFSELRAFKPLCFQGNLLESGELEIESVL
jgi:hypothetical protein